MPAATPAGDSLYERIGGAPQVGRLVESHYRRVLEDPELSRFFAHVDMDKLHRMQREFFTTALGGPSSYSGRPLAHVHQGRGITKRHFARFVEHLLESLESLGIDKDDIYAVIDRVAVLSDEITGGFGEDG